MSDTELQQPSSTAAAPANDGSPYNTGNWWGDLDDETDRNARTGREPDADSLDPNDPDRFIAHSIRKGRHGVVCGWSYQYGQELPLSDPCVYIGDTAGEMRHAKRYNPDGVMNWGEGTWTRIPDGTLDELIADLELWCSMSDRRFRESEKDALRQLATRQKKQQHENGLSDTDILANVVDRVRSPGGVADEC